MDKHYWHYAWAKFRAIKPWYFLAAFLIFGITSTLALRHNYSTMAKLRSAVYQADKSGGDVYGALQDLRNYVYHHMNTSLASGPNAVYPPIQLQYTYDRAVKAESAKTSAANSNVYTNAQNYCQAKIPNGFSGRYRVPCIQQYVKTHNVNNSPVPESLYEFDFVAARWSPDLAGWSLLAAALSLIAFTVSFALDRWFKNQSG